MDHRFMVILYVLLFLCIYTMCLYVILSVVGEITIHIGGQP